VSTQIDEAPRPHTRLRHRALQAGAWTIGAHAFETVTRLITNLIMIRLLFPEAFGVVAAALALISGLILVTDFGVHTVIIQSPRGDHENFLRSAWIFQLWRGALLWMILCALCAMSAIPRVHDLIPVGSVFANPSFPSITALLGTTLVLEGATSTALSLNARHLNFKPTVVIDFFTRLLSMAVMFTWAFLAPSVWALVAGILLGGTFRLLLSHVVVPGPRMAFNWEKTTIFGRSFASESGSRFPPSEPS
jgi:O-antigen/teichoic acid export membrane protein